VAEPVSFSINTFSTGNIPEEDIIKGLEKVFDLTPKGIIDTLKLKSPIYKRIAAYGHFGRNDLPWENLDKMEELKKQFNMERVEIG